LADSDDDDDEGGSGYDDDDDSDLSGFITNGTEPTTPGGVSEVTERWVGPCLLGSTVGCLVGLQGFTGCKAVMFCARYGCRGQVFSADSDDEDDEVGGSGYGDSGNHVSGFTPNGTEATTPGGVSEVTDRWVGPCLLSLWHCQLLCCLYWLDKAALFVLDRAVVVRGRFWLTVMMTTMMKAAQAMMMTTKICHASSLTAPRHDTRWSQRGH
jgi:hypothetical protein